MLWKNLVILVGLAWVTTTFADSKIASETMDDAFSYKMEEAGPAKTKQRGVANENAERDVSSEDGKKKAKGDLQYWNVSEEYDHSQEDFEPQVEDESSY